MKTVGGESLVRVVVGKDFTGEEGSMIAHRRACFVTPVRLFWPVITTIGESHPLFPTALSQKPL
jgi:hypothetical protein